MDAFLVPPIKGIFFDLGWTLLAPTTGNWNIPLKLYEFYPKEKMDGIPKEKLSQAIHKGMQAILSRHLTQTEEEEYNLFVEFYRILADELDITFTLSEIREIAHDHVYNNDNFTIFDDALATLCALKGRGYKLGIISNTWPSIERVLRASGLYGLFDAVTFSCHLGVRKPNPQLYVDALSRINLLANQTVLVDDRVMNLDGAAEHGIQGALITTRPDYESTTKYITINKAKDILDVLP